MDSFIWINLKRNLFSLIVSGFCLCLFASAQDESRKSEDKEKSEIVKENQTETSSSGVADSEIEYIEIQTPFGVVRTAREKKSGTKASSPKANIPKESTGQEGISTPNEEITSQETTSQETTSQERELSSQEPTVSPASSENDKDSAANKTAELPEDSFHIKIKFVGDGLIGEKARIEFFKKAREDLFYRLSGYTITNLDYEKIETGDSSYLSSPYLTVRVDQAALDFINQGALRPDLDAITPLIESVKEVSDLLQEPSRENLPQTPRPTSETSVAGNNGEADASPSASSTVRFACMDCDLLEFIRNLAAELKLNYVLDPDVQGFVNIHTYGEMKRSELMSVLETVLQINGAAIVKTGSFYRILPSEGAKQLPLEIVTTGEKGMVKEGRVLQIVPMQFVSAADMSGILTPYLSDGGDITYHQKANFLLITETPSNLKKLLELINIFDADVFADKRVQLYSIKHGLAKNLIDDLENIFEGYALSDQSAIRFVSIDRINAVLAISSNYRSFGQVEKWVKKLDHPGAVSQGVRNYIFKIQNGEAKNIGELLLEMYGELAENRFGTKESPDESSPVESSTTDMAVSGEYSSDTVQSAKTLGRFSQGEIKIVADEINNVLIVQCSPEDYEPIKRTIMELDRVPKQVLINVKIYEVVLSDDLSMGISYFLQNRNNPTVSSPSATAGNRVAFGNSSFQSGSGLDTAAKVLIGDTRELVSFLNAQENRSRSRVLSAPSIIASDNVAAHIQVGTQIPMLTSQGMVPGGMSGGSSIFNNTIQNRATGVILNVTPRINASGWVTLKVEQEVSSPGPPPAGMAIQSPSINIRSVQTQITVKDGQTIAIGGIISESKGLTRDRVPLLGRIPVVGLLFGNTKKTDSRTELIALITPHVIDDIEMVADLNKELKSRLREIKKILRQEEKDQENKASNKKTSDND